MRTIMCFLLVLVVPLVIKLFSVPRWSPAYLFCVFWWLQFAVCYIVFPNTPWSVVTALFIVLCCLAVSGGFSSVYYRRNGVAGFVEHTDNLQELHINTIAAKQLIIIFILLGFLYSLMQVAKYGFSLRSFFDLSTLLKMNNQIARQRYSGTAESAGIVNQILLSFTYVAPMAGGSFFPYAESKKDKLLCILTFVPELMVLFSQNLKAGFIACFIFWVSGFIVSNIRRYGKVNLSAKAISRIIIIMAIAVLGLMSTMVLRIGSINSGTVETVLKKFINYMFGHVGAIDDWINTNLFYSDYSLGGQTFIGVSRYLGFSDRTQGIYNDNYIGPDLRTNVFSYFRGLFQDYGFWGSILFLLIVGVIMGYSYKLVRGSYTNKPFMDTVLLITYSFTLYFIVSIFSYASYIVAFVLFYFYLKVIYEFKYKVSWTVF